MSASDRRIPITVLAGQSNANSTAMAVEVFRATTAAGGMMVQVAMNGSALASTVTTGAGHWNAPDARHAMGENLALLFAQLVSILDPASPSHVPDAYLDNIIWVQGEADAYGPLAARTYGANLRAFHAALTARFGVHDLVLSGLSDVPDDHGHYSDTHATNWDTIQHHQHDVAADLATVSLVDPDALAARAGFSAGDMFRWDYLHYDDAFASLLGRTLCAAAFGNAAFGTAGPSRANTPNNHIGTTGNDRFHLALTPFAQVLAGPGTDRAQVYSTHDLTVIEATHASTRIVDSTGPQPRILDLIRVESLSLGSGDDLVRLAGGVTTLCTGAGNDRVQGGTSAETLILGTGWDHAFAGTNNDSVSGGLGNDGLSGQAGRDWLHGGPGQDTIMGGAGHDRIIGGLGDDLLAGGTGADRFIFTAASGHDRITDFDPATDRLVFQDLSRHDLTLREAGHDVIITCHQFRLKIDDLHLADLHAADLIFT
jgi:RTX calcium-binding nonapeptide repeat (4 copies)